MHLKERPVRRDTAPVRFGFQFIFCNKRRMETGRKRIRSLRVSVELCQLRLDESLQAELLGVI